MKKQKINVVFTPDEEKIIYNSLVKRYKKAIKKHKITSLGFTNLDPQNWKDLAKIIVIIENTDM